MECLEHETILGLADDLAVLRVAVSLPNVEAIKRAVNFGLGVGILPKRCVKPDDPSSEPAERFLMLGRKESVYLMHGDSQRLSKAAEVFVKAMVTTTDQKAVESGGTSTTPSSCPWKAILASDAVNYLTALFPSTDRGTCESPRRRS